ncbi:N-Acetylneuraminate cytidylyltransferase [Caldibacillus thermoamylovorans]|nr:N-Acetylneuraminate cytidylyltransferase [Caldibacillus thermoamylovorans]KIO68319.1 N-Acetylneuraminate cytidylyltransferase [Caldibacillus thermoamylovorans]
MDQFLTKASNKRRQELPLYYRLNGAIYLSNTSYFLKYKDFYKRKSYAYIMEQLHSIDIDTKIDFEFAKVLLTFNNK